MFGRRPVKPGQFIRLRLAKSEPSDLWGRQESVLLHGPANTPLSGRREARKSRTEEKLQLRLADCKKKK